MISPQLSNIATPAKVLMMLLILFQAQTALQVLYPLITFEIGQSAKIFPSNFVYQVALTTLLTKSISIAESPCIQIRVFCRQMVELLLFLSD